MTRRLPCPAAPGPLEGYAARFDDLFGSLAQRRGVREYLAGLLAPRDRNKTLTCLAGAEPVTGAQHPAVQRLQFFLSESRWDPEQVNARRLELLAADPATAPHGGGVLVIDDSGDRKDGTKTAHVGHQYLGRYGKTDNGVGTVTTVWADERLYYPLHAVPYTPARHFPKGKNDPPFPTKLAIRPHPAVPPPDPASPFRPAPPPSARGVPRHALPPPRAPARARKPAPGRPPHRDHADLRHPQLDRAELQAGQRRAGLGRLPGPLRHRDPPPPGPGQRRVQLLLGRLVRRYPATARSRATAARTRPRREGGPTPPYPRRHRPGPGRCARYAPGLPPGPCSSAGGQHGPRRPRRRSCRP